MTIRHFFLPLTLGVFSLTCAWGQQYIINTFAGNRTAGFAGDCGAPTSAELDLPMGLTFDSSGNLYIADSVNQRIRKISGGDDYHCGRQRHRRVLRGRGGVSHQRRTEGPLGRRGGFLRKHLHRRHRQSRDPGWLPPAGSSAPSRATTPADMRAMADRPVARSWNFQPASRWIPPGNIYIADSGNNVIREIPSMATSTPSSEPAPPVQLLNDPETVLVDASGNLYICDQNGCGSRNFPAWKPDRSRRQRQ